MALVGVIEEGTVDQLLRVLTAASNDSLLALEQEGQFGHLLVQGGEIVAAHLGTLSGEQAIQELRSWNKGHYSLSKRRPSGKGGLAHALLVMADVKARAGTEKWLSRRGFEVSVVANLEQGIRIVDVLHPDVVIMDCPRELTGEGCLDYRVYLRENATFAPPLIITAAAGERRCTKPNALCLERPLCEERLARMLDESWPSTAYEERRRNQEEVARRVTGELTNPGVSGDFSSPGLSGEFSNPAISAEISGPLPVARATDGPTRVDSPPAGTAGTLVLAISVLLVASGVFWSVMMLLG